MYDHICKSLLTSFFFLWILEKKYGCTGSPVLRTRMPGAYEHGKAWRAWTIRTSGDYQLWKQSHSLPQFFRALEEYGDGLVASSTFLVMLTSYLAWQSNFIKNHQKSMSECTFEIAFGTWRSKRGLHEQFHVTPFSSRPALWIWLLLWTIFSSTWPVLQQ